MKYQFTKKILWILLAALLWTTFTLSRSLVLQPRCSTTPQACTPESVLAIDRFSIYFEEGWAEENSFFTQNLSGSLAFLIPLLWNLLRWIQQKSPFRKHLITFAHQITYTLQVICWNGVFTEISHFLGQRPRPFVYTQPEILGMNPSNYTAFYSGHTSFTAAVNTATLWILLHSRFPRPLLWILGIALEGLTVATGYYRVYAGRHFLTDVIAGGIAGVLIASILTRYQALFRKSTQ